ncbi:MAG TPA: hypothetical protein VJG30_04870 [Candidatus Nanoarchaeia archaeon]|nr:hypothetical protein [Candidatus Nanoarchaeia archaeon]
MKNKSNGTAGDEPTLELIATELYIRLDQLSGEVIAADDVDNGVRNNILTGYVFRNNGASNIYFTRSGLEDLSREMRCRLGAKLRKALRQLYYDKEFKTAEDLRADYPGIDPEKYTARDGEETYYLADELITSLIIAGEKIPATQIKDFMQRLAEEEGIQTMRSPTGQLVYSSAQAAQIKRLTNQAEIEYFKQKEANKPKASNRKIRN